MSRDGIHEAVAKYLITTHEAQQLTQEVDGNELHRLLMIREPFASGFNRRVKQCGLVKMKDYFRLPLRTAFDQKYPKTLNFILSDKAVMMIVSKEQTLIGQRIREYLEPVVKDEIAAGVEGGYGRALPGFQRNQ